MVDEVTQVKIGYGREDQDQEKESGCFPVEKETGRKKEYIPERTLSVNAGVNEQHHKIESPEKETGEDQRFLRIKQKYVDQDLAQLDLFRFRYLLYSSIREL